MPFQSHWGLTVVICMFWIQSRTASRSPVWPWRTGIKPSMQIPLLSLVISRLQDGTLWQQWSKPTNPPEFGQFLWEHNHLLIKQGILYRWARPWESEEAFFQLVLPATQREVALKGCHDEVGHFGMEHMLDLMCPVLLALHDCSVISRCCPCLAFKAKQPKSPLENIMATHPLEHVHLDYLCLEPGKGLEENVLVVTDHFTRYALVYLTRTQTAQTTVRTLWDKFIVHYGLAKKILLIKVTTLRVSWWLASVSWWGYKKYRPAHTIHRPMASVKGLTPLWLVCWECCPQRRSQSGKITLEHYSMPITALETQLQGSAPTISCVADIPSSSWCYPWSGTSKHYST